MSRRPAGIMLLTWCAFAVGAASSAGLGIQSAIGAELFRNVVIDNAKPRRDTMGDIVDVHEGCLKLFHGKYYLYGTHYDMRHREGSDNTFAVYSSSDLHTWTKESDSIVQEHWPAIYARPKVIYEAKTRNYVLWFYTVAKDDGGTWRSKTSVALSRHPSGPFGVVRDAGRLQYADPGDFAIFVDADGIGFVAYSHGDDESTYPTKEEPIKHHQVVIERLSADYLNGSGEVTNAVAGNVEAPVLFKRRHRYYLLFDNTCEWCKNGSGVRVYVGTAPMGPFVYGGNINRENSRQSPWTYPGTGREDNIVKAQETDVAVLPSAHGDIYLWMGDRWDSSLDGISGHDFEYWQPLSFDDNGMIEKLRNQDDWVLQEVAN